MFQRAQNNSTLTQPRKVAAPLRIFETHITGNLDVNALQSAYKKVIKRHDALQGSPATILGESIMLKKWSNYPCLAQLINNEQGVQTLRISFDSSIVDQQSIATFFSELNTYYNNHDRKNSNGIPLELPKVKPKTKALTEKQKIEFSSHWQNKLEDLTNLNLVTKVSEQTENRNTSIPFLLESSEVKKLRASFPNIDIDKILTAVFYALLSRHSAQTDITLGCLANNRQSDYRPVGKITQQLPLRLDSPNHRTIRQLCEQASIEIDEARAKQLPSGDYISLLNRETKQSLRGHRVFDALVSVHDFPPCLRLNGTQCLETREVSAPQSDASLVELSAFICRDGSIKGSLLFNNTTISKNKASQILMHFEEAIYAICENPNITIADLPLLLESEVEQIQAYNDTYLDGQFKSQIPDTINELAAEHSTKEMLRFHAESGEPQRITYQEFDNYTSRIANHLRETHGLNKGDRVLVSINRSFNTFAYIFGAMKAGLVPIPIESKQSELFVHKVTNSSAEVALTDNATVELFKTLQASPKTINIDDETICKLIANTEESHYSCGLSDDDPAYIMYSSGTSTGIPKRSVLTHGGLRNLLNALASQGYDKNLKVLCTAPADFDAFLFDFLVAWATGGSIHITEDAVRTSPEVLTDIIRRESIDYTVLLPELMSELAPDVPLRYLITMGAAPRPEICQAFLEANKKLILINGWGLTEAGVCQSLQNMIPGQDAGLIGKPIANMRMYVLDTNLNICPPEVPGEIYLAGPGLAAEYDKNPELTASKFFTASFNASKQRFSKCKASETNAVRLFSTGDLGHYQEDSNAELSVKCIGRSDRRVKFYGVSLDLDAIEIAIAQSDLAASVAVKVDNPDDIKALHAFVEPSEDARGRFWGKEKELRRQLREAFSQSKLPPVACPQFILIAKMPLTKNGKINYRQLNKPLDITSMARKGQTHDLLSILKTMWKEILCNTLEDIDDVTTWEQLGGNSFGMAQLESRLNSELTLRNRVDFTYLRKEMTILDLLDTLRPLVRSVSNRKNSRDTLTRRGSRSQLFANEAGDRKSQQNKSNNGRSTSPYTMK